MADGKELAKKYCVSCHQLPDPALIDSASWVNGVLPAMAKSLRYPKLYGAIFYRQAIGIKYCRVAKDS